MRRRVGFSPVLIIITVVVLLLGAAGAAWYFLGIGKDASDASVMRGEEGTATEPGETDAAAFSGGYFDAIERGKAVQCTFRLPEGAGRDFQVGEGKFYTDGVNRGFSSGQFEIDGAKVTSNAIFDAENIYSWTDLPIAGAPKIGIKINRAEARDEFESMSDEERQDAYDYRAKYDFDCQPWTVDESKFQVPSDIEFRSGPSDTL